MMIFPLSLSPHPPNLPKPLKSLFIATSLLHLWKDGGYFTCNLCQHTQTILLTIRSEVAGGGGICYLLRNGIFLFFNPPPHFSRKIGGIKQEILCNCKVYFVSYIVEMLLSIILCCCGIQCHSAKCIH